MAQEDKINTGRTGLYERTVGWVTAKVKPYLHKRTMQFINKSVAEHGEGNERYGRIIEFEVRRRGDAAGLTQDVAEPLVWAGVKTAITAGVALAIKLIKQPRHFKWLEWGALGAIAMPNIIDSLRVIPRYTAGLQGSLEIARDRIKSIKETGVDPFKQQSSASREINTQPDTAEYDTPKTRFTETVKKAPDITPAAIREQMTQPGQPLERS